MVSLLSRGPWMVQDGQASLDRALEWRVLEEPRTPASLCAIWRDIPSPGLVVGHPIPSYRWSWVGGGVVFWDDGTITPCDRSPSRRENRTEPRDKRGSAGSCPASPSQGQAEERERMGRDSTRPVNTRLLCPRPAVSQVLLQALWTDIPQPI